MEITDKELEQFEKKSLERDIEKKNYSQIERMLNNMSPIDYDLSHFKKKDKEIILNDDEDFKKYETDDYIENIDIDEDNQEEFNFDIMIKGLDY